MPTKNICLPLPKSERVIVSDYLRQEIDFNEPFAFVEYWGRGYTQDCLTRLLADAAGHEVDDPMYYVRSIYPTIGKSIRYNYTCNTHSVVFLQNPFLQIFRIVPSKLTKRKMDALNQYLIPVKMTKK